MTKRISAKELAKLLDEYSSSLALYASNWTNSGDDCVQEAFVELAGLSEPPDNPVAWLFRVVRNRSLNATRSSDRRREREKQVARPESGVERPDLRLIASEEQSHLLAMLNGLEPGDRELVVLRIWSGLTWSEIAELTGISSSSAHRRYEVALQQIKKTMTEVQQG